MMGKTHTVNKCKQTKRLCLKYLHFQYGIPDKLKIVQFHSLVYESDKIVCCQSLIMHKFLSITIHADNLIAVAKGKVTCVMLVKNRN